MFLKNSIIFFALLLTFSSSIIAEDTYTFSNVDEKNKIADLDFVEFIKDTIILQPEYRKAIARKGEFLANKKYAQRLRFPTLEAQVYNDRTISRDITANDYQSALRKTRDDTFDGIISIDQKIYSGNEINSKVRKAREEMEISDIDRDQIASELVLQAVEIYVNASSAVLISDYASDLLSKVSKYRDTAKARFNAGAIENSEFALINIRLSEIEVKATILEANKVQNLSLFFSFYKDDYNKRGLPSLKLSSLDNFEIINLVDTYDQLRSSREVKISEHNLEITKSQYRPKLGFAARFTQYDLDDEAEDQDIRGGFYVNFPVFSFGRGSAQVGAGKAKVQQAKINKDVKSRESKNISANLYGSFLGSLRARDRLLVSYDNVKLQRETFEIRMSGATFSTAALLDAALKEIYFYEQLIENEKKLLMADLNSRHLRRQLLNRFKLIL